MPEEKKNDAEQHEHGTEEEVVDNRSEEQTDVDETVQEEAEVVHPLEAELKEANDRLARTRADYDNFRRRTKEEREAQLKYKSQTLIETLLPALDNFERALAVNPESEEAKQLLQGMEMVYRQIEDALQNEGVTVIPTKGEMFDPHYHQAVMQVEEDGFESNQIVDELQKGYQLKDRVIRHSMVKVNS
ncbi:nucleotide exchange factor GrpE [Shouchella sp. JSM 1781072]|uniref:nucleotide exchange factor GrpE n=1 Tax=Bacillaceae TaxID=186817 RepID=UPI000C06D6CD|nr:MULTISPECIES: nucleotide exchange factor GrpE [Bacillaceae]UTR07923.1 nucleotide exchange factor GrpE [Alkalihalobacillus sp. LMS6]